MHAPHLLHLFRIKEENLPRRSKKKWGHSPKILFEAIRIGRAFQPQNQKAIHTHENRVTLSPASQGAFEDEKGDLSELFILLLKALRKAGLSQLSSVRFICVDRTHTALGRPSFILSHTGGLFSSNGNSKVSFTIKH
ncbi:hypothetical protein TNIN_18761 [Trichonephila inaurata madagascariensis]|uniref:Uncharacterized protein n=1 Tax=Trichonephila inaurata madagascariensis TaxID=2747483 RepID=A0A8X6KHB7_9ARAC|nr:hypothetical protein TNIN_18761 [Trichonephila inaurata madagascariensis]